MEQKNDRPLDLVIYDSFDLAADNGEYAYRKIRDIYPDAKLTFLISRTGRDYKRLKEDGFNVRTFEGGGIEGLFKDADFILFSKNMGQSYGMPGLQSRFRYKTIFLDHGVTATVYDDSFYFKGTISNWAKYILVTSEDEKQVIDRYSGKKLKPLLLGFPRHDILLEKYRSLDLENKPKQVFISFHWRVGGELDYSQNAFRRSSYLKDINELLNSQELKNLVDSGVKVCFLPHARFLKYVKSFKVPKYVEVPIEKPFQDILVESDVLVTDFSSNNFEMAYMDKPSIIYVPGLQEVKRNHRNYHIENLNYPQMVYCKNREQVFASLGELFSNQNARKNISDRLFKYVDTDNTKRLVDWMLEHREEPLKNRTEDRLARLKENARFWYG